MMTKLLGAAGAALALSAASASAASILVFGDFNSSRDVVARELAAQGHSVTNRTALASDLSGFDTIWHVGVFTALTPGAQSALSSFLAEGKGIYLSGERPCCETSNASVGEFVNANLKSGSVTVGGFGDVSFPFNFNSDAIGNLDGDLAEGWVPSGPGQIDGVTGRNVVITARSTGRAVAAAWSDDDLKNGGRIALFMDVNWVTNLTANEKQVIANLQEFLFDGFVGPNPAPVPRPIPMPDAFIPLPAGAWLMLAGLGALTALRRKQRGFLRHVA